jgi:thioredoxin 1|tara:strand:- start:8 stop:325 length:318 start_codon:yes stop_codon:yes gene_type:complete
MTITNLTEDTFHDIINNSDVPVLVDFWAEWCGPCKMIAPAVEEISQKNVGKLLVGKVDIDTNPDLAQTYQIRSIPALMVFVDGEPQEVFVGAQKSQIEQMVGKYI